MKHSLIRILTIVLPLLLATASPLLADTIVTDGGNLVLGTYTGGGPDEFRMGSKEESPVYSRGVVIALVIGTGKIRARASKMISETDRLDFQDGTVLEGRYAGGDETTMRFEVDGEIQSLPLSKLARLTLGHPDPAAQDQGEDRQ